MAYVRKKTVKNREYFQLVESRRVDGKPRQHVLVHLGQHPTVEEALKAWPKEIKKLRNLACKERSKVQRGSESDPSCRKLLRRAVSAEKRAYNLQANLNKLRDLKKSSVV